MLFTVSTQGGDEDRCVVWPPEAILQTSLGSLRDASGNFLPRDIGRSSVLSDGTVLFQFGDTFCHNLAGDFIGATTNTCAISTTTSARTVSSYFVITDSKGRGRSSEQKVPPFLEMRPDERDTPTHYFKIWCFSGVVETHRDNGNIYGLCWFEARYVDKKTNLDADYLFTGISPVIWNREKKCLEAARQKDPVKHFLATEPRFGTFCAVTDSQYIYLYGHTPEGKSVVLARVRPRLAMRREEHKYWDGTNWSSCMRDAKPVFTSMQHGQIFQTDMFGRDSVWKWAFIGCTSFADSRAMMGRAMAPEGPWQLAFVGGMKTYRMVDVRNNTQARSFLYCFYPHPWAFDIKRGDLMISWSEGGLEGDVIADLVRLKTTERLSQY